MEPAINLQLQGSKSKSIIYHQMKAIVINNIRVNHRCSLFWKEVAMIAVILGIAIVHQHIEIEVQAFLSGEKMPKYGVVTYNLLAMVFVARASVMVHMQNRKKFLYFQKAYGLNTLAYILRWVFYSLIMGALKFFCYIFVLYFYLEANNHYFSKFQTLYPGATLFSSPKSYCTINFMCYLSIYSYCLFLAVVLGHNQIGLKLLTPLIITAFISLGQSDIYIRLNMHKFIFSNPFGWLVNISYYGVFPEGTSYTKSQYIAIFLCQFSVPLICAVLIEWIKTKSFEIKKYFKAVFFEIKGRFSHRLFAKQGKRTKKYLP